MDWLSITRRLVRISQTIYNQHSWESNLSIADDTLNWPFVYVEYLVAFIVLQPRSSLIKILYATYARVPCLSTLNSTNIIALWAQICWTLLRTALTLDYVLSSEVRLQFKFILCRLKNIGKLTWLCKHVHQSSGLLLFRSALLFAKKSSSLSGPKIRPKIVNPCFKGYAV